jgi:hypothetical protein
MNEKDAMKIETIECGTVEDGSAVILALAGKGFRERYTLPTTALAVVIEQLLKMHNTARAHSVLNEQAQKGAGRKVQPVLETFLVDEFVVVTGDDDGPVTVRIVSGDGSRDIVFPASQWARLRAPLDKPEQTMPSKPH